MNYCRSKCREWKRRFRVYEDAPGFRPAPRVGRSVKLKLQSANSKFQHCQCIRTRCADVYRAHAVLSVRVTLSAAPSFPSASISAEGS